MRKCIRKSLVTSPRLPWETKAVAGKVQKEKQLCSGKGTCSLSHNQGPRNLQYPRISRGRQTKQWSSDRTPEKCSWMWSVVKKRKVWPVRAAIGEHALILWILGVWPQRVISFCSDLFCIMKSSWKAEVSGKCPSSLSFSFILTKSCKRASLAVGGYRCMHKHTPFPPE